MKKIESKTNPKIKLLKKLGQKKYRQELGLFLVENFITIKDASTDGFFYEEIFVTEEFFEKHSNEISKINTANVYIINNELNKSFSNLDSPSGISAVYKIKKGEIDNKLPTIYLNSINDPGNLGTIIRTMLAFGFKNLVLDENCADIYNPKVVTSAKNAIFKINILHDQHIAWLKSCQKPIYISLVDQGEDARKIKRHDNYCLVIGSESHGIDQRIIELADKKINIKMKNEIESLNASIAAAILMHELSK